MPKKIKSQRSSFGSIKQLENGKWFGQVTVGYDENGKQIRKSATTDTKEELAVKLLTLVGNKEDNHISQNITLEKHMLYWLLHYKVGEVTSRTLLNLIRNAKLHIFPKFGQYHPKNITSDMLQEHFISLTKKLSTDTVKKIKQSLNQYYMYCYGNGVVKANPVSCVKLKKTDFDKKKIFVEKGLPSQYTEQFLKALETDIMFKTICYTIMDSSERPQELIALKWKDVDFLNGNIYIGKAVTFEVEFDGNGKVINKTFFEGDTKNGVVRKVPVEPETITLLAEWKEYRQKQCYGKSFHLTEPNDYIFGTHTGKRYTYYGLRTLFDKFLAKNGLKDSGIHFYNMRHTCCNNLFAGGTAPAKVQYIMGHSNIKTTLLYNTMKEGDVKAEDIKRGDNRFNLAEIEKKQKIDEIAFALKTNKISTQDLDKLLNAMEQNEPEM